ncbi:hypothetical protein [Amaricoccus sp. W119]|uniref:hypothetical protein n=1 Tax=Amaricoccus sp. W119 TaxID=3391833 RepID=UPI0039A41213
MTKFRVKQNGMTVASTEGPNAEREIWHYAHQYREEGEVTIQHNAEGHWKRFALLCQWPVAGGRGGE